MLRSVGVRGRLLLAFFGISAFAVLAAAAGMYSFLKVSEALDKITGDRVPSAVALLQLAAQSERIVAAMPTLASVRSKPEKEKVSARIEAEVERLHGFVRALEGSSLQADALEGIVALGDGLGRNLEALGGLVSARLDLAERKQDLLRKLNNTHLAMQRLLGPGVRSLEAKRAQLERVELPLAG